MVGLRGHVWPGAFVWKRAASNAPKAARNLKSDSSRSGTSCCALRQGTQAHSDACKHRVMRWRCADAQLCARTCYISSLD